jgi:hypothetical protein
MEQQSVSLVSCSILPYLQNHGLVIIKLHAESQKKKKFFFACPVPIDVTTAFEAGL